MLNRAVSKTINIKGELFNLSHPVVMGILNVTPDSFYSGSRKTEVSDALKRVEECVSQGAINKEFPDVILSIDTFYADVARFSVQEHGIDIINDISGGELDSRMFETVADLNVPYILMHMKGTPQNMQQQTDYGDLLEDIVLYLSEKVRRLHLLGVNDIILDPGFGFAKDVKQNYELMRSLSFFKNFELPLLVGISRKSMITRLFDIPASEALNGTTVLNTYALLNGADILRVHDVKEAVEAVKIVAALTE